MTSLRILHIDDEPDIREIVALSLGLDSEISVRSCASGADAIAAATDWSPDVILCDVMMPVMDGPATLARLRGCSQTADIPVVFMTARAQTRELEHLKSLGATGVIAKPFDPLTLPNIVRNYSRPSALAPAAGPNVEAPVPRHVPTASYADAALSEAFDRRIPHRRAG